MKRSAHDVLEKMVPLWLHLPTTLSVKDDSFDMVKACPQQAGRVFFSVAPISGQSAEFPVFLSFFSVVLFRRAPQPF